MKNIIEGISSDIKAGMRFGQLIAVRGYKICRAEFWLCMCACGGCDLVRAKNMRSGNRRSCGCVTNRRKVAA